MKTSYHGLLLVNKPTGMSSHDVVQQVRRALGTREVGHAGTLDPLATGLMVLLLGEGTKLSDYVLNGDKAYTVRVKLGRRTDTLDVTGQVLSETPVDVSAEQIRKTALELQGTFHWSIPLFSAAKVGGEKLYALAREGQRPETPKKDMKFWDVQVQDIGFDFIQAHLNCSKGSFIRSWAAELGERLGVGGVVETLERTHSHPYALKDAVALDQVGQADGPWQNALIPIKNALPHWRTLTISGKDERLILNGQVSHDLERRLIPEQRQVMDSQEPLGIKILSSTTGDLLALLEAQPNRGLKIRRVFKNTCCKAP